MRREEKCDVIKIQICDIMVLGGKFRRNKVKKVPLPKISLLAQIGGVILAPLCPNDSNSKSF